MTPTQFTAAIASTHLQDGQTVRACRMVLVDGLSQSAAATACGINRSAVSRAIKKIPTRFCRTCKQPI